VNRAEATVTVDAGAQACFDFVAEPANLPRFMAGIKEHRPQGRRDRGKGASFDSVAEIAGRNFETVLVMTEWRDGEKITATSQGGLKLRATFVFEEFDDGTTDVTLVNEYEPPGVFRLMGGLVRSTVETGLQESLESLKRMVEEEGRGGHPGRRKRAR
jgi:uncharacterized membrane protein